jgi:hypothetical protein
VCSTSYAKLCQAQSDLQGAIARIFTVTIRSMISSHFYAWEIKIGTDGPLHFFRSLQKPFKENRRRQ